MDSQTQADERQIRDLVRSVLRRDVAAIAPLPAGLGSRRFYRASLRGDGDPATTIARIEAADDPALRPAGIAPEPPLEPIRALLEQHGLPVPACHAIGQGLILLEDVGSTSLEAAIATRPSDELQSLYREACELIPRLQAIAPAAGNPNFARRLDETLFRYKAEQLIEWVLPRAAGDAANAADAEAVREAFAFIAGVAREAPQRLAHRDFKAANLHLHCPALYRSQLAAGRPRLTMIDLQGAFLAPPEYDLVCLLRDSHVELDEGFVQSMLDSLRPQLPDAPDASSFALRFALLTLTRNGKDLARYLYAARARSDERYLSLVPRAIRTLQAAAREVASLDPTLERLAQLLLSLPASPPRSESACGQ